MGECDRASRPAAMPRFVAKQASETAASDDESERHPARRRCFHAIGQAGPTRSFGDLPMLNQHLDSHEPITTPEGTGARRRFRKQTHIFAGRRASNRARLLDAYCRKPAARVLLVGADGCAASPKVPRWLTLSK